MFGFLKKKLKEAVDKFTKSAESEVEEAPVQEAEIKAAKQEEQELLEAVAEPVEDITEEVAEEHEIAFQQEESTQGKEITEAHEPPVEETPVIAEEIKQAEPVVQQESQPEAEVPEATKVASKIVKPEVPKTKKGFFSNLLGKKSEKEEGVVSRFKEAFTKRTLSPEKFDELFWELEVAMLENNVAIEVIEKIKHDLKEQLTTGKVSRMGLEDQIQLSLRKSLEEVLSVPTFDLLHKIKKKKPFVIAMIGVNGTGKTTTLAKLANLFKIEGLEVVIAASDTFRAAAIDQLKEHADKLGVKMISQGYNADPAAVAFDAIEHAKAKNADVVMIDTAGRLHSNTNLMAELEKVIRVARPDLKIFVGESITGNDCVEQAKEFDKIAGIDAIILSKADVDEKGGAAISVSFVTKKPILYLGVGQAYGDLKKFDKHMLLKSMGL